MPYRYTKNPEFNGLEEHVWEYLNTLGQTIPIIISERGKKYGGRKDQRTSKNDPIWHNKADLDAYVARCLGLRMADYGADKSKNKLYKAVAGAIQDLRRRRVLIDWDNTGKNSSGVGIWRLDKTRLDRFVGERAKNEMAASDFHADGVERTIYVRAKQGVFRDVLVSEYNRCMLCGFSLERYMIGAHIVPYSVMRIEDSDNAMNPRNGLLLCRICDVAFERCDIRVEPDLGVVVSDVLTDSSNTTVKKWTGSIVSQITVKKSAVYPPDPYYLKWKMRLCR